MRPHVEKVLAGEYMPPACVDMSGITRVLDLGANVGAFSVWASQQWPNANIRAVEPIAANIELLIKNTDGVRIATIHGAVVGGEQETVTMRHGRHNCGECSIYDLGEQDEMRCEQVKVVPPNEIWLREAEFIKIDVEGAELNILSHGLDLSKAQIVAMEWHRDDDVAEIERILFDAGLTWIHKRQTRENRGILFAARPGRIKAVDTVTAPQSDSVVAKVKTAPLVIGLPIYGDVEAHFFWHAMKLVRDGLPATIMPVFGDSLIPRARNTLASQFLRTNAEHLLFIDSDLIFSPEHVRLVVDACKPGYDVVGGYYPKKQRELAWVLNSLEDGAKFEEGDLAECKYIGTGFMCIRREVLERMAETGIDYEPDGSRGGTEWDFFPTGVVRDGNGKGRYLSEDWYFCRNARALGFRVWAHRRVVLKHVGKFVYPMDEPEWEGQPTGRN